MKTAIKNAFVLFWAVLCTQWVWGQTQNTYQNVWSRDHMSVIDGSCESGRTVFVGTLEDTDLKDDITVIEVDQAGNVVINFRYQTEHDERAYHVNRTPEGNYVIVGDFDKAGYVRSYILILDCNLNYIDSRIYQNENGFKHSRAIEAHAGYADPNGGYLVVGFTHKGADLNPNTPKTAYAIKLDNGLNWQWEVQLDSPSLENDYDMLNHVVEIPGLGYFVGGTANYEGFLQTDLASVIDYNGNTVWRHEFFATGAERTTGGSCYYSEEDKLVYQLINFTDTQDYGVVAWDPFSGNVDFGRSYRFERINNDRPSVGLEINPSLTGERHAVGGYLWKESWTDPDGVGQGGWTAFVVEMDKTPAPAVGYTYLVPSPSWDVNSTGFVELTSGGANGGVQPYVLHSDMSFPEKDDTGYLVSWYREINGMENLEGIATLPTVESICPYDKPEWVDKEIPYKFIDQTVIVDPKHVDVGPFLNLKDNGDEVTTCAFAPPCTPDTFISVSKIDCDTYTFTAGGGSTDGTLCYDWYVDGVNVGAFTNPFTYTFSTNGPHTVCVKSYCCDGSASNFICVTVDVNCCNVVPNIEVVQNGCVYTFTIVNNGTTPDSEVCVWVDVLGGVVPLSAATWTVDFTGLCTGYGVCFDMFCCNEDPSTDPPGLCIDYYISCCCTPDMALFSTTQVTGSPCCYNFADLTPDTDATDDCEKFVIIDAVTGIVLASYPGETANYCFDPGTYKICYYDCCIDPVTGVVEYYEHCEELVVDGPCCQQPCEVHARWAAKQDPCCTFYFYDFSVIGAGTSVISWFWDFGDGNTSNLQNPVHTYATEGTRTVCLTVTGVDANGNICSDTFCWDVTCDCCDTTPCTDACLPTDFLIGLSNCNTYSLTAINGAGTCDGLCYDWYINGALTASNVNPFVHTFTTDCVYEICMKAYCCDNPNISTSICITINVNCGQPLCLGTNDPDGMAPDPNDDNGQNVDVEKNIDFTIYPNPSEGKFNLLFTEMLKLDVVKIYDSKGNVVKQMQILGELNILEMDLGSDAKGLYSIQVTSGGKVITHPVMID
jgi:hypothetical protein